MAPKAQWLRIVRGFLRCMGGVKGMSEVPKQQACTERREPGLTLTPMTTL